MGVRVHEVGHSRWRACLGGDLVDRSQQVVTDRRRCVDCDDTARARQEHGLVEAVGHPVEVVVDVSDVVTVGVQGRTEGSWRNGCVRRQGVRAGRGGTVLEQSRAEDGSSGRNRCHHCGTPEESTAAEAPILDVSHGEISLQQLS
jgi:hypothetical protein